VSVRAAACVALRELQVSYGDCASPVFSAIVLRLGRHCSNNGAELHCSEWLVNSCQELLWGRFAYAASVCRRRSNELDTWREKVRMAMPKCTLGMQALPSKAFELGVDISTQEALITRS